MGKGGGCSRCCECGGKFEAYSAEEYAEGQGEEPDYDTCPAKIGHFAPGHSTGRAKSGHFGTYPGHFGT